MTTTVFGIGRKTPYPRALRESEQVRRIVEEAVDEVRREVELSRLINASARKYVDRYREQLREGQCNDE